MELIYLYHFPKRNSFIMKKNTNVKKNELF
jgi:hypothetical protein